MKDGIAVFAEQRNGKLKKVSLEAIGVGIDISKQLQKELSVVVIGHRLDKLVKELSKYGADNIYIADDELLADYSPDGYVTVLTEFAQDHGLSVILLGATSMGKDISPKLAARLKSPFISDCMDIEIKDGGLIYTRPMYGGKVWAKVASNDESLQVVTLRQNIFSPPTADKNRNIPSQRLQTNIAKKDLKTILKDVIAGEEERIELTEAKIIVSGGRGLKAPENFYIIENLAKVLNAAVGASRAVVDAGWRHHSFQVGLTGKTVTPTLYIACGISGAVQHQAGMSSSKYIVAINTDPDAPIFKIANYGIVGDLFEVVPLLTEEIKKLKEEG
ncbi:MAG: electron transfer flavoprotein subunit alpha/FixB family protein [Nitrospirota bacterium]